MIGGLSKWVSAGLHLAPKKTRTGARLYPAVFVLLFVYIHEFESVFVQPTFLVVLDPSDLCSVDDDHLFIQLFISRKDEPDFIKLLVEGEQTAAQIFLFMLAQHPEGTAETDIDQIDDALYFSRIIQCRTPAPW